MEGETTYSDSYATIEGKIRRSELALSELEHLLEDLFQGKKITATEQEALLELAWGMNTDQKARQAGGSSG